MEDKKRKKEKKLSNYVFFFFLNVTAQDEYATDWCCHREGNCWRVIRNPIWFFTRNGIKNLFYLQRRRGEYEEKIVGGFVKTLCIYSQGMELKTLFFNYRGGDDFMKIGV